MTDQPPATRTLPPITRGPCLLPKGLTPTASYSGRSSQGISDVEPNAVVSPEPAPTFTPAPP